MSPRKPGKGQKPTQTGRGSTRGRVGEAAPRSYPQAAEEWISASEFKARCLELMDVVRDTGRPIVITKRGTPVAKLVPFTDERPNLVGYMRGTVLSYGDLISPIDVEWDADK